MSPFQIALEWLYAGYVTMALHWLLANLAPTADAAERARHSYLPSLADRS